VTNKELFDRAMERAAARKAAKENMPAENEAFLKALRDRWYPMGKLEDYILIERLLVEAWAK
jgi:hypothetical protein